MRDAKQRQTDSGVDMKGIISYNGAAFLSAMKIIEENYSDAYKDLELMQSKMQRLKHDWHGDDAAAFLKNFRDMLMILKDNLEMFWEIATFMNECAEELARLRKKTKEYADSIRV